MKPFKDNKNQCQVELTEMSSETFFYYPQRIIIWVEEKAIGDINCQTIF